MLLGAEWEADVFSFPSDQVSGCSCSPRRGKLRGSGRGFRGSQGLRPLGRGLVGTRTSQGPIPQALPGEGPAEWSLFTSLGSWFLLPQSPQAACRKRERTRGPRPTSPWPSETPRGSRRGPGNSCPRGQGWEEAAGARSRRPSVCSGRPGRPGPALWPGSSTGGLRALGHRCSSWADSPPEPEVDPGRCGRQRSTGVRGVARPVADAAQCLRRRLDWGPPKHRHCVCSPCGSRVTVLGNSPK